MYLRNVALCTFTLTVFNIKSKFKLSQGGVEVYVNKMELMMSNLLAETHVAQSYHFNCFTHVKFQTF